MKLGGCRKYSLQIGSTSSHHSLESDPKKAALYSFGFLVAVEQSCFTVTCKIISYISPGSGMLLVSSCIRGAQMEVVFPLHAAWVWNNTFSLFFSSLSSPLFFMLCFLILIHLGVFFGTVHHSVCTPPLPPPHPPSCTFSLHLPCSPPCSQRGVSGWVLRSCRLICK